MLMLGMQALQDAFLTLFHFTIAVVWDHMFGAFTILAFFQLVLFSILEMRLILQILKAQRPNAFEDLRRELGILYIQFYVGLISGIMMMYLLPNSFHVLIFIVFSFWLPQILHQVATNRKHVMSVRYIVGMTIARLMPVLYFFACPSHFLTQVSRGMQDYWFAFSLVLWVGG